MDLNNIIAFFSKKLIIILLTSILTLILRIAFLVFIGLFGFVLFGALLFLKEDSEFSYTNDLEYAGNNSPYLQTEELIDGELLAALPTPLSGSERMYESSAINTYTQTPTMHYYD